MKKITHHATATSVVRLAGIGIFLALSTACSTTHTAYKPVTPKPFESSSGVQVYGEIDVGYGYSRQKASVKK